MAAMTEFGAGITCTGQLLRHIRSYASPTPKAEFKNEKFSCAFHGRTYGSERPNAVLRHFGARRRNQARSRRGRRLSLDIPLPQNKEEFAVETKVMGEVSKVFPFFIFEAIAAKCNPAVQLETATAYLDPTYFKISH